MGDTNKPKRKKTFGRSVSKKYDGMMSRCYRPNDRSYKNYGGRGIKVCSEWIKDIDSFKCWVIKELERLNIPLEEFVIKTKNITLDRIDVNGHYGPSNCRFATHQEQIRNRRISQKKEVISAEGEKIYI